MFQKLFAKFARAISDERERKDMYELFLAIWVFCIAFFVLGIAFIIEIFIFAELLETIGGVEFTILGVTIVLYLISAITALVLLIKFRLKFKRLINRPTVDGELPEISSYRQKLRNDYSDTKKTIRVPAVILALGVIYMLGAVIADAITHPDSEDFTALGISGIIVLVVTLFIFVMWLSVAQIKKTMNGGTVEMRVADDAKKIDAAQGRTHEYSLVEDNTMRSLIYLFPNPELRKEAKRLSKRQVQATLISALVSIVVSGVITLVFFSPVVYGKNLLGYAFPTFVALMFVAVMLSILPVILKSNKLEKRQRAEIDGNPSYEKTMRIYKLYDDFSKFKNKIIFVFLVAAVIVGFALAIVFPDALWSLVSMPVLLIGLLINNKLLAELRKNVLAIEDEISELHIDVKFVVRTDEDERSIEVYQAIKTVREYSLLVAENGGGDFELYLGKTELCLDCDIESKRVADLSGKLFISDVPTAHVDMPAEYDTGILYFEFDDTLGGSAVHIAFDDTRSYDPENKLLVLGTYSPEEKLYKVTANMYVQITDGKLGCIMLSEI